MIRENDLNKYEILSGSMLKTIALISMLIDHTAVALLSSTAINVLSIGPLTISLYTVMRKIGRVAFPIYCFLLVEGYRYTRSFKKYASGIFVFALISEIPWNLVHVNRVFNIFSQNVFFTLFLGLLGIYVIDRVDDLRKKGLALIALLFVSIIFHADYGSTGFLFIILLFILKDSRLYQAIASACILGLFAACAFIPISLYNGERGYIKGKSKYIFYMIYPLHLMVLWCLQIIMKIR